MRSTSFEKTFFEELVSNYRHECEPVNRMFTHSNLVGQASKSGFDSMTLLFECGNL